MKEKTTKALFYIFFSHICVRPCTAITIAQSFVLVVFFRTKTGHYRSGFIISKIEFPIYFCFS